MSENFAIFIYARVKIPPIFIYARVKIPPILIYAGVKISPSSFMRE